MIVIGSKVLSDADCKYVLSDNLRSGDDGQILIPKEICDKLYWNWKSEFQEVQIKIHKANIITAMKFASVYGKTEIFHKGKKIILDDKWYEEQLKNIATHFGDSDVSIYTFNISLSTGNRHYVNGLKQDSGLNLQEFLIPKYSSLVFKRQDEDLILQIDQDQINLRGFCFGVFKILVKDFGDEFLKKNAEEVDTKIGEFNYKGIIFKDYFGSSKLLAVFELGQAEKVINSDNRFRYQKEPVQILYENREVYFSTEFEFNRSNESHILFDNYKRFIEDYSDNKFSVSKDTDGYYQLLLKDDNSERILLFSVKNSLREFAFKTFQEVHREFGDAFLNLKKSFFDRTHNDEPIKSIGFKDYFGSKKIFAVFDSKQDKSTLKTGISLRYNPTNLGIMGEENIYFSSQWSHPYDKSHPYFEEFVHFINDYGQGLYEIEFEPKGKIYSLFKIKKKTTFMRPIQKIYFGPPGSGKSHLIKSMVKSKYPGNWPRVTFHPELDYQGFVGSYKPAVDHTPNGDQITYRFVEEAFLRAYCEAWDSDEPYYLIIEEINRGNCAQIFGDIFQLLDRGDDGFSEYPIICSPDIQRHLKEELKGISRLQQYTEKTGADDFTRMSLPDNLNILCTMNTSDQSLFPMDSAFKRRWDWQYVPIDYKDAENFRIDLEDGKKEINWGKFIEAINLRIKEHTQSEDKQIGNRFVSPRNNRISKEQFVSKVVFYLWSEIYKEEYGSGLSIFPASNKGQDGLTFSDFFKRNGEVDAEITRWFIEFNLPKETEKNSAIEEGEIEVTKGEE
jgi:hypothetical protein